MVYIEEKNKKLVIDLMDGVLNKIIETGKYTMYQITTEYETGFKKDQYRSTKFTPIKNHIGFDMDQEIDYFDIVDAPIKRYIISYF